MYGLRWLLLITRTAQRSLGGMRNPRWPGFRG